MVEKKIESNKDKQLQLKKGVSLQENSHRDSSAVIFVKRIVRDSFCGIKLNKIQEASNIRL